MAGEPACGPFGYIGTGLEMGDAALAVFRRRNEMKRKIAGLAALIGGLMLSGCVDDGYGYGGGGYGIYSSSAYPRYYDGYYNGYYGGGYYRGAPGYRAVPRGNYYRRDYDRRDNGNRGGNQGRWEGRADRPNGSWNGRGNDSGWQQRNNNWSRNPAGTGQPRGTGNWGGRRR
jgi:hypothetical protein